jgi:WD40 repeat protein
MDYISAMRTKYHLLFVLFLQLGFLSTAWTQDASYILKRQSFKEALTSINISPDGLFLLAGFNDGSFRLLDPDSFELRLEVLGAHHKAVNAIDMPPKMDFILTAGHNSIKLWDRSGKHLFDWNAHATTIWNAEISSNGLWAVSSAMNKTFLLWDVYNNELAELMRGHENVCMAVCISPDNRLIASGSNDLSIRIWDLETRQVISQLHGPTQDIYDVEFSPDGSLLVACSKDKSARLYDMKEKKLLHILKGHSDMVLEAEFSPNGRYLVSASADQSIILWDVLKGERVHQFLENEGAVMDLVFHPDGQSFYSISYAGDLTRWEVNPEVFVLKYYEKSYMDDLAADPLFEPRRKGESKKEYESRMAEATAKKNTVIANYYELYLSGKEQ